ncbi:TonB-dependent receptor [Sulfurimonas sp. HSL3-7]|uniref:TonB-dependent receptor n=1 Tax=Sulfonitrofixus jiaomeiensis TaxID=3131938 RepID=UPI0031F950F6
MKKALLLSTLVSASLFAVVPSVKPVNERSFSQSQYIPDISLVTDFSYVYRNVEDSELQHLEVPGIAHGLMGSHSHGTTSHATYNANNGFNLNYAELVLSSSVDPYFNMDAVFHFSEHGVEVEEAYFTTTSLPAGLRFRAGKMLSEFGRINSQHHHFWDFGDMPLVYEAFLGNHGINELGAQLQWVAPMDHYLMIGVETLQGTNESMFGNAAISDPNSIVEDAAPLASEVRAPSLFVGYVKTAFDIGNTTILPGISYAYGSSRLDHFGDEESPHAFAGNSALYGADLTVKHYFDSYSFLTWQSEWMMRDMDGTQYVNNTDTNTTSSADLNKKQAGYYTQLVYAYDKNWRAGVRYDNIYKNDVTAGGTNLDLPDNFNRYSAMAEYHPSEFSRIRLQYNHNEALFNEEGERQDIDTVMVQFNIAIGAHGAHDF